MVGTGDNFINTFTNHTNPRTKTDNINFDSQKIQKMKNRDGSFKSKGDRYVNKSHERQQERHLEDEEYAHDIDFNDKYQFK